ncbi:16S rRNA (guanine(527)-N(7))-methyltransferase RsmG [Neokomagataea thailandica]|uniref:Ribosomal RNA small subunit methyltransferase G n=1 Tax=Neokomagataea tanensis NBRC 106556 TaxID=1223519 RepID=A0ABQ0QJW0_9PROT|nr:MULTISPECIES: 16S rRNA (guanine(527)-N(7))-methyltransferase RsmG [Neokomagataea]GBR47293.1 glucose inhibited division protein B [Neokomagataea tanensis NBRC 106556]
MVEVSRETQEKLERFAALLTQWNARINLVSPRDLVHLWPRHIEDSLQLAALVPENARITDLGSGGGFPGIILAIATGLPVTLVESDQRKCAFLREAARECGVKVQVVAKRIETVSLEPADVVTARALAPMERLLGWARPLLKPEGFCLFLKGAKAPEELTEAQRDWHLSTEIFNSRTAEGGVIIKVCDFQRVTR